MVFAYCHKFCVRVTHNANNCVCLQVIIFSFAFYSYSWSSHALQQPSVFESKPSFSQPILFFIYQGYRIWRWIMKSWANRSISEDMTLKMAINKNVGGLELPWEDKRDGKGPLETSGLFFTLYLKSTVFTYWNLNTRWTSHSVNPSLTSAIFQSVSQ